MSENLPSPSGFQEPHERIRTILSEARARAYRAINTAMVAAYWEIGRVIVEHQQQGQQRAEYGKGLLVELSQRLTAEFGRGFDRTNLQQMRAFYVAYPICDALRPELSWTYYRLLLRVDRPEARAFYETEAVNSRWSTREPERQMSRWKAACAKRQPSERYTLWRHYRENGSRKGAKTQRNRLCQP